MERRGKDWFIVRERSEGGVSVASVVVVFVESSCLN